MISAIWSLKEKGMAMSGGRGHVIEGKESKTKNAAIKFNKICFCAKRVWCPPDSATLLNFLSPKSLDHELSADLSFVSVLPMVLPEY